MDDPIAQYIASPQVGQQAASVVQIESGKLLPIMVLLTLLIGVAIGLTVYAFTAANQSERETRMLEYYVMELDGKLMNEGFIKPDRSWSAQKQSRKEK